MAAASASAVEGRPTGVDSAAEVDKLEAAVGSPGVDRPAAEGNPRVGMLAAEEGDVLVHALADSRSSFAIRLMAFVVGGIEEVGFALVQVLEQVGERVLVEVGSELVV